MDTGDIEARVKADLERGDFGLARDRLLSQLSIKGYQDDVLIRLGRISFEMHDLFHAGRLWLASSATGEEVDRAVAEFIRRCGGDPQQAVSQLPRACRLTELAKYPAPAQDRFRAMGMSKAVLSLQSSAPGQPRKMPFRDRALMIGCVIGLLFGAVCTVVGAGMVLPWIWKLFAR